MKLSSVVAILAFSASMVVGSPAGIPQTLQKRCSNEGERCSIFLNDCCDGYRCVARAGTIDHGECVKPSCNWPYVELKLTCPANRKSCGSDTDCGDNRDGWRCSLLPLPDSADTCDITLTKCCENVGCIPKGQECVSFSLEDHRTCCSGTFCEFDPGNPKNEGRHRIPPPPHPEDLPNLPLNRYYGVCT
ncbi:unnamed protein product [Rhizoctonia solani]|uniref:Uncharacterized protein n=1 Tax=Rhizoctonia solani TaxID=456999 RepID=A0A8H3HQ36_9AGAM|nr:unnamed protein product [Rhizoctonia solani]